MPVYIGQTLPIGYCQVDGEPLYSNQAVRDGKDICWKHEEEIKSRILDELEAMPGPMAGRVKRMPRGVNIDAADFEELK